MVSINLQSIEKLIFYDKQLRKLLPEFSDLFGQWELSKMSSVLRGMGMKAAMDLLNAIADEHIKILEGYFGVEVVVDKMDYCIVKSLVVNLEEAEGKLNELSAFSNFSTYRDGTQLYILFWR